MPTLRYLSLQSNKKKKIEKAIIQEMMTHSFEHINISNIVSDASISRGSFYQYFQNKHDFYFYILSTVAQIKRSYFDFSFLSNSKQPFIKKIKHILEASIRFSKDHQAFVDIGMRMYASKHKDIKAYFDNAHQEMSNLLMEWLLLDKTYQSIQDKHLAVEFISTTMTYLTQYALNYHSMNKLESYLMLFIKILEGGLKHV